MSYEISGEQADALESLDPSQIRERIIEYNDPKYGVGNPSDIERALEYIKRTSQQIRTAMEIPVTTRDALDLGSKWQSRMNVLLLDMGAVADELEGRV